MISLISNAYAAAPAGAAAHPQEGGMGMIVMLVFLLVFFYFLIWRPQSKRNKAQRDLMSALSTGDEVVTAGGLLGKLVKVGDVYVVLSLADNIEIKIQKSSISSVLPKGTLKSI